MKILPEEGSSWIAFIPLPASAKALIPQGRPAPLPSLTFGVLEVSKFAPNLALLF